MANPTGNNAAAGDLAKTSGVEVWSRKSDATGMAKGDVVHFHTDGTAIKGTASGDISDGFGVALEAVAANADGRFAVGNTYVYVIASGAIIPNNLVKVASTAGEVVAHTDPGASPTTYTAAAGDAIKNYFGLTVGRYYGHQLEEVGDPTDAADNDVIAIRLGL